MRCIFSSRGWDILNTKSKSKVSPISSFPRANIAYVVTEHRISGEILAVIDADGLKEVGVATIGQRLAILRATYLAKLTHNVPISRDSYIPPCMLFLFWRNSSRLTSFCSAEMDEIQEAMTIDRLGEIVRSQGQ